MSEPYNPIFDDDFEPNGVMTLEQVMAEMERLKINDPYLVPNIYGDLERWVDVPGYKDRYQFSNTGRLRSLKRGGKIIAGDYIGGNTGERYQLWRDGKMKWFTAEQLTELTWPNPIIAAYESVMNKVKGRRSH